MISVRELIISLRIRILVLRGSFMEEMIKEVYERISRKDNIVF